MAGSDLGGAIAARRWGGGTVTTARALAVKVLHRVTEQGAYASLALDAELSRARLGRRDAALATAIVYGTLRALPALDRRIAAHLRRPDTRLDAVARAALRAAAFQLLHLAAGAPHAVVFETVEAVRAERGPRVGGFVNAILRKLAAERPSEPRLPERMALPEPLEQTLVTSLGPERLQRLLACGDEAPPLCLRAPPGERDALLAALREAGVAPRVEPGGLSSAAVLLWGAGDPRSLPGHREGRFAVQEQGAQLLVRYLGAQPGERVLDACAGHGGKTVQLVEDVSPGGHVVAVDRDERKLDRIGPELARLGLPDGACSRHPVDLSVGDGGLPHDFDRVLVDAPCSGLGTLRRRPELALGFEPGRVAELARLQVAIVRRVWPLLAPGGILVYAVCSPLADEALPGLTLEGGEAVLDGPSALPGADPDGITRIGPWLEGETAGSIDAYQIRRWRKKPR